MVYLVDSSVWIALYRERDSLHGLAEEVIAELRGTIYLPYGVLIEVATVLTYKHSKRQADQFLAFAEESRNLVMLAPHTDEEAAFFKLVTAKISWTDATLLMLTESLPATLVTFDKQLAGLSKRHSVSY